MITFIFDTVVGLIMLTVSGPGHGTLVCPTPCSDLTVTEKKGGQGRRRHVEARANVRQTGSGGSVVAKEPGLTCLLLQALLSKRV